MGEVFLARQEGPAGFAKTVVIKRILDSYAADETFVQMFLDEARLAALLNHQNVVQIYELGKEGESYFIAMEYVDGRSLSAIRRRLRQRHRVLFPPIAARIARDALRGLHYAHTLTDEAGRSLQIVHRDVSPDNILLSFGGTVKLVDFGIAKASVNLSVTQNGALKGKFLYMAPEIIRGGPASVQSDLYSMGVVLYEAATGVRPFEAKSQPELFSLIVRQPPPAPALHNPQVAPALSRIILRAMSKAPRDRFQSAEEMADALEEFVVSSGLRLKEARLGEHLREVFADELAAREEADQPAPVPIEGTPPVTPRSQAGAAGLDSSVDPPPGSRPGSQVQPPTPANQGQPARPNQLIVLGGRLSGRIFDLATSPAFLGREPTNDVAIDDPAVGQARCMVFWAPEGWMALNLAEARVSLNGERFDRAPLRRGDVLRLGEVSLVFSSGDAAPVQLPGAAGPLPDAVPATPFPGRPEVSAKGRPGGLSNPQLRPGVPGAVLVPAQQLASAYGGERPVPAFWMDRVPVTNRAFLAFVEATGELPPAHWLRRQPPQGCEEHPVVGVSLDGARRYASWRGRRLPTAAEWEAASRGPGGAQFPWGDAFDPQRCHGPERSGGRTAPVGQLAQGASPAGCLDLVGNVWEWTEADPEGEPPEPGYGWVFGGSFCHPCCEGGRIARHQVAGDKEYLYVGFRCAVEAG